MLSNALSRPIGIMLALALAGTLPHNALAGHEELVAQHRFMRAELIGALYLPGDADTAIAAVTSPGPIAPEATIITASHACDTPFMRACTAGESAP